MAWQESTAEGVHAAGPDEELAWMLQLHDAWEVSIGDRRAAIEAEMVEDAPTVVAAALRHAAD